MVNLSLTEKGGSTNELSFEKDEVTIGRVRGNDIVLPKGNVSKHHCRLLLHGGEFMVEDLRSTNGTYVNGRKIAAPTPVSLSDKVFVGDFIIRLTSIPSAESARPAFPPGPPEAGSLSTAIPRRPPPPPPVRGGVVEVALDPVGKPPGSSHTPPAPLVSAKRDLGKPQGYAAPLSATNIDLDDEDDDALRTPHPHFTVPPLKPAVQVAPPPFEIETAYGGEVGASTPEPAHGSELAGLGDDDGAPPEPPSSADDDVMEGQSGAIGNRVETPSPAALDEPSPPSQHKVAEPAKSKAAPLTSGRRGARPLDRDLPDWLAHILGGEGVTAAFLTGSNQAEVQRNGRREPVSVLASDMAGLGAAIRKLAAKATSKPDAEATAFNVSLPDGTHISAIFPPAADRLCVVLCRPVAGGKTLEDLVEENVISSQMQQVLEACVSARQNILVSGDRVACDSLLSAILWSVDRMARVILLSDTITPPASASSWIKLQTSAVTSDLIAAAVALQPEYLIADVSHSSAAGEILAECDLGLRGAMMAIVARSSTHALARLRAVACKQGAAGPQAADMVSECIDVVVQASVLPDGSLKVVELAEPKESKESDNGQVSANALVSWIASDDGDGSFAPSGIHSRLASKLAAAEVSLPDGILDRR
jgi:pilus assembly protein CpaF